MLTLANNRHRAMSKDTYYEISCIYDSYDCLLSVSAVIEIGSCTRGNKYQYLYLATRTIVCQDLTVITAGRKTNVRKVHGHFVLTVGVLMLNSHSSNQ